MNKNKPTGLFLCSYSCSFVSFPSIYLFSPTKLYFLLPQILLPNGCPLLSSFHHCIIMVASTFVMPFQVLLFEMLPYAFFFLHCCSIVVMMKPRSYKCKPYLFFPLSVIPNPTVFFYEE